MRNILPAILLLALLAGCAGQSAQVSGRVQYLGEPVEGATVKLLDQSDGSERIAIADDEGVYIFKVKPKVDYLLVAERPGDDPLAPAWSSTQVTLPPGGEQWVGLQLVPWEGVAHRPIDGAAEGFGSMTGKVVHEGAPVQGAVVSLYLDREEELKGPGIARSFPSGGEGEFFIDEVAEGVYFLAARLRKSGGVGPIGEGDLYGEPVRAIEIRSGQETVLNVQVVEKQKDRAPFAGELTRTGTVLRGVVVDGEGEPVAGLHVFAYTGRDMGKRMPDFISPPTGPDGFFELPLGEGGLFYVGARKRLGGSPQPGDMVGFFDGTPDHGIRVEKGKVVEDVKIVVHEVLPL